MGRRRGAHRGPVGRGGPPPGEPRPASRMGRVCHCGATVAGWPGPARLRGHEACCTTLVVTLLARHSGVRTWGVLDESARRRVAGRQGVRTAGQGCHRRGRGAREFRRLGRACHAGGGRSPDRVRGLSTGPELPTVLVQDPRARADCVTVGPCDFSPLSPASALSWAVSVTRPLPRPTCRSFLRSRPAVIGRRVFTAPVRGVHGSAASGRCGRPGPCYAFGPRALLERQRLPEPAWSLGRHNGTARVVRRRAVAGRMRRTHPASRGPYAPRNGNAA